MREISLREVLDARERRAWKQQELLRQSHVHERDVWVFLVWHLDGPFRLLRGEIYHRC